MSFPSDKLGGLLLGGHGWYWCDVTLDHRLKREIKVAPYILLSWRLEWSFLGWMESKNISKYSSINQNFEMESQNHDSFLMKHRLKYSNFCFTKIITPLYEKSYKNIFLLKHIYIFLLKHGWAWKNRQGPQGLKIYYWNDQVCWIFNY